MSDDFSKWVYPEIWEKTIIVLWNDNWMRQAIAKALSNKNLWEWGIILGTEDNSLNEWKQPDLSKFLKWMIPEEWKNSVIKVKTKVSKIID